jgi:hypothetical protein
MPVNPSKPAIKAMIKNVIVQLHILIPFLGLMVCVFQLVRIYSRPNEPTREATSKIPVHMPFQFSGLGIGANGGS